MCQKANAQIQVVADASSPSGVLGSILEQDEFEKLLKILDEINSDNAFEIQIERNNQKDARTLNRKQFGKNLDETHCFRGYPIVGSIKQFFESDSEYVLHIDCDMLFYEEKIYLGYSKRFPLWKKIQIFYVFYLEAAHPRQMVRCIKEARHTVPTIKGESICLRISQADII